MALVSPIEGAVLVRPRDADIIRLKFLILNTLTVENRAQDSPNSACYLCNPGSRVKKKGMGSLKTFVSCFFSLLISFAVRWTVKGGEGQEQVWFGAYKFSEQRIVPSSPVSLTWQRIYAKSRGDLLSCYL